MQTFLPYADFEKSLRCLSRQHLCKQRVEAYQIYQRLIDPTIKSWQNHPAVRMWRGHTNALIDYYNTALSVWAKRGYVNDKLQPLPYRRTHHRVPAWLGNRAVHQGYRSNLVRKNAEHYRQYFPKIVTNLPYVWPTKG